MVVDTSVLLAIFFNEAQATWCADQLNECQEKLVMSTVNLAETLILLKHRQGHDFQRLKGQLFECQIEFVAPDRSAAEEVARIRLRHKELNLGDCFAYALAKIRQERIITLDADFKDTELEVILPPAR